jgi:hypothetical protein
MAYHQLAHRYEGGSSRLVLPPSACGSPTDHHSGSGTRVFPNADSCLRLVRALTIERHEAWLEDHRYLNMDLLKEYRKEALRQAA